MANSPYLPNTTAISAGIVALLQTVTFPGADDVTAYKLAQAGAIKDITDLVPWACVEAVRGSSKHYAAGGRVEEKPIFRITSGVQYQDSTQAEIDILNIRDAVVPVFQTHSTLQGVIGVYTLNVQDQSEQYAYLNLLGTVYRVHMFEIVVFQQYQLQAGVKD